MLSLLRKKKNNESWGRYLFGIGHLWLGLLASIVLFIVCLTGSILVFEQPVKKWVNANQIAVNTGAERLSLNELAARFDKEFGLSVTRMTVPENLDEAVHLYAYHKEKKERVSVYFNPYTGEVVGHESASVYSFFSTTMHLHRWLLNKEGIGKDIVGASTLIFLFLMVSGIVLWWPKKWKQLKHALRVKWDAKFYRVNYDLHSVLGFYTMLGLFFIAATGLYFSYEWYRNGLKTALGKKIEKQSAVAKKEDKQLADPDIWQKGYDQVQATFDYASPVTISAPGKRNKHFTFRKYNTDNWLGARLPEQIELTKSGELHATKPYSSLTTERKVTIIIRPLHTGEIMGWPSMLLYFVLCLVGTSLPITGFIIWYKREKKSVGIGSSMKKMELTT